MKKTVLFVAITLFSVMAFNACNSNTEKQTEEVAKIEYTCSMHPDVVQSEAGDCPECGMALVEKTAETHDSTDGHEGHNHD